MRDEATKQWKASEWKATGQRRAYEGRQCLPRDLVMLGYDAPDRAGVLALPPHHHPGMYEVCLILDGAVEWWARDEEEVFEVGPRHVYLTRPDEVHGGVNATIQPSVFYWLMTSLREGPMGMSVADRSRTRRTLDRCPRCFPASETLVSHYRRLMAEHERKDTWSQTAAEATFHAWVVALVRDAEASSAKRDAESEAVAAAKRFLLEHLAEPVGVDEAAEVAGLSVTRFHERFRAEVGQSPADWRNRQRIDRARRRLLETDHSVTRIAMDCGFATSQYFATAFKRQVGVSPSAYRRQVHPSRKADDGEPESAG